MARNAEDTRQKILDAATEEFARYGIAGARVDRITTNAGVNNALLYRYFGSKLDLFDTVYTRLVGETVDAVPFDPSDLPGYVGGLFDYYAARPEIVRLTAWYRLERPDAPPPAVVDSSTKSKIDLLEDAQRAGTLPERIPSTELFALLLNLSLIGTPLSPADDTVTDRARRRTTVVEAARTLLAD